MREVLPGEDTALSYFLIYLAKKMFHAQLVSFPVLSKMDITLSHFLKSSCL